MASFWETIQVGDRDMPRLRQRAERQGRRSVPGGHREPARRGRGPVHPRHGGQACRGRFLPQWRRTSSTGSPRSNWIIAQAASSTFTIRRLSPTSTRQWAGCGPIPPSRETRSGSPASAWVDAVAWLGAASNPYIRACVPYYGGNLFVTWGAGEQTPLNWPGDSVPRPVSLRRDRREPFPFRPGQAGRRAHPPGHRAPVPYVRGRRPCLHGLHGPAPPARGIGGLVASHHRVLHHPPGWGRICPFTRENRKQREEKI